MTSEARKIVVNGRFLGRATTGVERFARDLLAALDELGDARFSFTLLAPRGTPAPPLARIGFSTSGRLRGHAWEQFELPFRSTGSPLLNLCNLAPVARKRQLTIIHDAAVFAVPEGFSVAFRGYYRLLLPLIARRSRRIVTVSNFSRRELGRYLDLQESAVGLVQPAADAFRKLPADDGIMSRLERPDAPFALAVGSLDPRKNLIALARAAERIPDRRFVLVGGANQRIFADRGVAFPSNVQLLGRVSDGELKALYGRAACFVFPSRYEGFGLPPLEAMTCGCPVIAANAASLPEVCGDAALYFDPDDPEGLARAVVRMTEDEDLRDELRARGVERARRFGWRRSAVALLDLLDEVFPA